MKASFLSVGALFVVAAIAQPHRPHHAKHHQHKRDNSIVWVTDWEYVTETVPVTTTIWVSSGFVPPTTPTSSSSLSKSSSTSSTSQTQVPAQFFQGAVKPATPAAPVPASQAPPPSSAPPVTQAPPPASVPPVQSSSSSSSVLPPIAPVTPLVIAAAAPALSPASSGSSTGECSSGSPCQGDITYYEAGLGACGDTNNGDSENVVALPHGLMGAQSNGNPYCGKMITITSTATGKTTTAKVVDKCMGCVGYAIDLSNKAFLELDDFSVGRTGATWHFN